MKIYEKLLTIQTKLVVEKNKYNDFASFKYRSCEDILQALKPYLKELGFIIKLDDELIGLNDKVYIKATARLIDIEDGEVVEAVAYAQEPLKAKSKMDESQTTGSTSSYARKYALNGLLALDDNADSDQTNNGKTEIQKEEKLITAEQIEELKKLGFDDSRLLKMAQYYKVNDVTSITFKNAEETIKKQKIQLEKDKSEANK